MNLAKLMEQRGLNQVELAKRSGLSQPLISHYLRGGPRAKGPTLGKLVALANALNCTLEELTGAPTLHGVQEKAAAHQPSPQALAFAEALEKLPEDDPRRKAIEMLLMDVIAKDSKEEPKSETKLNEG